MTSKTRAIGDVIIGLSLCIANISRVEEDTER